MARHLNRRDFVKSAGATAALLAWPHRALPSNDKSLRDRRKQAAHRRRRMIMNNDGNDMRAAASIA